MIFTDLPAAVEEARYRCTETGRAFAVVQQRAGRMKVLIEKWVLKKRMLIMYSTRYDRYHTVLPEIK
ncbi:hypothetical protein [Xenorhabdus bovienii]|uniref:hypothetical protein n=1 Tax=Xenorhabdus bovienii TaxID=40576 RepID=UPI0023B34D04|nr:hypothetical protein [Xenorhabdus bovienii]